MMQILKTIEADLLVIGGGINGVGIANDAQGRGLKVVLSEKADLASATSSWSSKLIHGGLRYLEQYEFKLVREALREREILLNKAPHIIEPITFVLPHAKHLRPKWIIRAGLFLYDHLSKLKSLKKSKGFSLKNRLESESLKDEFSYAFSYSDCKVDDSRLVILNARQAKELGAEILVNAPCIAATRIGETWEAILQLPHGQILVKCRAIVNAAGPWVADVLNHIESKSKSSVRLVQGSHIVVPKLYNGTHAYILQNKDNRIVFAIPYGFTLANENQFTLIGTTDTDYHDDPSKVQATADEVGYLCELINEYFKPKITPQDVIWSYSGVRPLYDDHAKNLSKVTREYHFELEDKEGKLPLLSVFGGKITTYRTLAEHALKELKPYFKDMHTTWTKDAKLPGGEANSLMEVLTQILNHYPWLNQEQAYRYAKSYGTKTFELLKGCQSVDDLGEHFGYNFYEKELRYMIDHEWAFDLDGLIWRRSKLGLWLNKHEIEKIQNFLDTLNQNT